MPQESSSEADKAVLPDGSWSQALWVQILAPALTTYVTLVKLIALCLGFPSYKMEMHNPLLSGLNKYL